LPPTSSCERVLSAICERNAMAKSRKATAQPDQLEKCPTGITGLDEITEGGLPRGRPTLVCGSAGSGKTLLGMEFIVRGTTEFGEPGVFMAFEETVEELSQNFASLGFDVNSLIRRRKLAVDYVHVERSEIEETGEYDLEGLFVRLGTAIDSVGARRVVLDTVEALFAGLPNEAILRAELRRLFRWLKMKGVTAIITGETGDRALSRHGLEEYVSDCVIYLDHRVINQVATRRLRIIKYRGSRHGTNEYPTVIDETGLSVMPISSLGLSYAVTADRVSSGIPRLDAMLGGKGYYRGSSILISGTAGTGKSSLAVAFADSVCRRGGRCLYLSFEESPEQLVRNMRSIAFHLDLWRKKDLLRIISVRPTLYGLEMHLSSIHKHISEFAPDLVIMDPITNMVRVGEKDEAAALLVRVIAFLKSQGITVVFTSLTGGGEALEQSEVGISSLMDTWILVRMLESDGERNRLLIVLKSRGMAHSNQMREFQLTDHGIKLNNVYVGPGQVLTGSARLLQEARDRVKLTIEQQNAKQLQRELQQERASLEAQVESLKARLENIRAELKIASQRGKGRREAYSKERRELAVARSAD
jgi:circadian clock protein KaiC